MDVKLIRADVRDAERLWRMQVEAFWELYERYQDTATSPAAEPAERVAERLKQPFTYYYYIQADDAVVGAVRVIDTKDPDRSKKISPIFIMPPFRNRGIGQKALLEAERIHGSAGWELDTILQEAGNCHLYEKMGYRRAGKMKAINDKMTLVFYKKDRL